MHPQVLCDAFSACGLDYYAGVPDSLLQPFCAFLSQHVSPERHVVTANEGNAIGLAMGRYLATGNPAVVYMQNSGLGNVVNPITSVADNRVSGIPMMMVIGWRGEVRPNGNQLQDEPQHVKMGRITEELLTLLDVKYARLDASTATVQQTVLDLITHARQHTQPVALLVQKNTFESVTQPMILARAANLSREQVIETILQSVPASVPIISTTGMTSRELFELRVKRGESHDQDFLTVGAMGHTSQIASGIASAHPGRVVCLDGDGSTLMHLGALSVNAQQANLLHIVINNGVHDSVGGQPIAGSHIDFCAIARACGYVSARRVDCVEALRTAIHEVQPVAGAMFVEVRCKTGNRSNLGRPSNSPQDNKKAFMRFLQDA